MSVRTKFIGSIALAGVVVATWRFISPSAVVSLGRNSGSAMEPTNALPRAAKVSRAAAEVPPASPPQTGILQSLLDASRPAERRDEPGSLTEQTLVGTKWERDGFGLEFGAGGKLLIGGRERAKWSVAGQRVRLYRDATGEEHWLDIVGNKLLWNSQEIGRVP